jgi:hypothetical protein
MKTALFISITVLHLMTVTTATAASSPDGIAVIFIIDTRWSCDNDMPELRTLARQGLGATERQDYLEILTAHSGRPRIRLAQTSYHGTLDQTAAASRILADISAGFLASANVSNALKMALDRLENACPKQGYRKALVIILSDGHLEDSDVARVLKLAGEFRQHNWPLYITGDKDTNKNLLIAANKGQINWSSIADANPALWLQQARASLRPKPEDKSPQRGPTSAESSTTKPTVINRTHLVPRPPSPVPNKEAGEHAERASTPSQDSVTASSRTEVQVTFPKGRPRVIDTPKGSSEKAKPSASSTPVQPSQKSTAVRSAKDTREQASSHPKQPLWTRTGHLIGRIWPWLAILVLVIVLAVVGYAITRDGRRARQIRQTFGQIAKKRPRDDGMLIATINGLTRQLGRRSRLRTIYVGSGARNTLRVTEKGVSDRHLCLYQKAGKLMLQNLSTKPITVSGMAVAPRAKRPVALPAVIELAENIKLHLRVLQPSENTSGERSENP